MEMPECDTTRLGRGCGRVGVGASPQDGTNPGNKLSRVEWLRKVIVGAQFKSYDAIDLVTTGSQHDYRHLSARLPHPATYRKTVLARQHDIQYKKIEMVALQELVQLHRIRDRSDFESLLAKVFIEKLA